MDEPFQIPVTYKGTDYLFDAQLYTSVYQYRIEVLVNEIPFYFERDDSGDFRAIAINQDSKMQNTDPHLLRAIADTLQEILS